MTREIDLNQISDTLDKLISDVAELKAYVEQQAEQQAETVEPSEALEEARGSVKTKELLSLLKTLPTLEQELKLRVNHELRIAMRWFYRKFRERATKATCDEDLRKVDKALKEAEPELRDLITRAKLYLEIQNLSLNPDGSKKPLSEDIIELIEQAQAKLRSSKRSSLYEAAHLIRLVDFLIANKPNESPSDDLILQFKGFAEPLETLQCLNSQLDLAEDNPFRQTIKDLASEYHSITKQIAQENYISSAMQSYIRKLRETIPTMTERAELCKQAQAAMKRVQEYRLKIPQTHEAQKTLNGLDLGFTESIKHALYYGDGMPVHQKQVRSFIDILEETIEEFEQELNEKAETNNE